MTRTKKRVHAGRFLEAFALFIWALMCWGWLMSTALGVLDTLSGRPVSAMTWGTLAGIQFAIAPRWAELFEGAS